MSSAIPATSPCGIINHEPSPSMDMIEIKHLFVLAADVELVLDLVQLRHLALLAVLRGRARARGFRATRGALGSVNALLFEETCDTVSLTQCAAEGSASLFPLRLTVSLAPSTRFGGIKVAAFSVRS